MRFAVVVEFRVKPENHETFRRLILANAAASLDREPGCQQFDVLVPEGEAAGHFVLYEIYADAAAFEAHLRSDHYRQFDKAVTPIVVDKKVIRLSMVEPEAAARPHTS